MPIHETPRKKSGGNNSGAGDLSGFGSGESELTNAEEVDAMIADLEHSADLAGDLSARLKQAIRDFEPPRRCGC